MRENKSYLYCNDRKIYDIKVSALTIHYNEMIPKCGKICLYFHQMLRMNFSEKQSLSCVSHKFMKLALYLIIHIFICVSNNAFLLVV